MKIQPRPLQTSLAALVKSPVPKELVTARSYEQLVTSQGVHPDRAKRLLGLTK
jgi:hypothetical protein